MHAPLEDHGPGLSTSNRSAPAQGTRWGDGAHSGGKCHDYRFIEQYCALLHPVKGLAATGKSRLPSHRLAFG